MTAARRTAAYVAAWVAGAAVLAVAAILVLDDGDAREVSVPPLQETELRRAARAAGCELRRAEQGEQLNPPVDGPQAVAAAAEFYEEPPPPTALVGALRRGVVVIHYRDGLDPEWIDELQSVRDLAPTGTIVTPNATAMPFELAVTSYRRLLGCPSASDGSLEAVRLFRGRFVGTGPDG